MAHWVPTVDRLNMNKCECECEWCDTTGPYKEGELERNLRCCF